ncbi:type VI secretion system contractile sheath large subunit [Aquabacter sp. CN5-332]|uniref:type VI secretion system contractile sheath domain-containing protein n=1 Tax=Aquabacter sp. CN5-332 TaxID=3156608 RepID=UPI0032B3242A
MANEDKPQGGVRLDMGFGSAFGGERQAAPARSGADIPFRLVVVGDFGGAGDGRLRDISGDDISSLMAAFGAVAAMEVPNHLGSAPPALAIRLPLAALRDLDPKTLAARIPEIARAERLAAAYTDRRSEENFEALARDPALDRVAAELRHATAPLAAPAPKAQPASEDDGSLDRLLGMVDVSNTAPQADPAQAAISAFLSSTAKPRQTQAGPTAGVSALLQSQAREVAGHASWLRLEAAWRSLRLIFAARGRHAATRLTLCDVPGEAVADLLQSEQFADALADQPEMTAILVLGAFGRSPQALDALDRIALAADRLSVPTIVSLAPDFLGAAPADIATMDNPRALLEGPGYAAWRGLRGRDESSSLFAAWNDIVLRPAGDGVPTLWGEAGVILAAQILRSLERQGWPTEITGAETALDGLEMVEVDLRGGRRAAIPLRAPVELGVARELGHEGIICLVCRADRDQAWLTRAPAVHGHGAMAEADRKIMEDFSSLPFRFVSRCVEDVLHRNRALFAGARSDGEAAAAMARLLDDVLLTTGQGAAAHVSPSDTDEEGRRHFEVSVRLGQSVMGGFSFSFDIAL